MLVATTNARLVVRLLPNQNVRNMIKKRILRLYASIAQLNSIREKLNNMKEGALCNLNLASSVNKLSSMQSLKNMQTTAAAKRRNACSVDIMSARKTKTCIISEGNVMHSVRRIFKKERMMKKGRLKRPKEPSQRN